MITKQEIINSLNTYPYFLIVGSEQINIKTNNPFNSTLLALSNQILKPSLTHFSTRQFDPNGLLIAHTDTAFYETPFNYIGLEYVIIDDLGGANYLLPIDDLKQLPSAVIDLLKHNVYQYSNGLSSPVIIGDFDRLQYHRHHLNDSLIDKQLLDPQYVAALNYLDNFVLTHPKQFKHHCKQGDILLLNNYKTLHGRFPYNKETNRKLYRLRFQS